jgi:hypothetical protein
MTKREMILPLHRDSLIPGITDADDNAQASSPMGTIRDMEHTGWNSFEKVDLQIRYAVIQQLVNDEGKNVFPLPVSAFSDDLW